MIYHVKIDLAHTGSLYVVDDSFKAKIKAYTAQDRPLASFGIKINRQTLLGEQFSNKDKEEIALSIKEILSKGRQRCLAMPEEERSNTKIPAFDINFTTVVTSSG